MVIHISTSIHKKKKEEGTEKERRKTTPTTTPFGSILFWGNTVRAPGDRRERSPFGHAGKGRQAWAACDNSSRNVTLCIGVCYVPQGDVVAREMGMWWRDPPLVGLKILKNMPEKANFCLTKMVVL